MNRTWAAVTRAMVTVAAVVGMVGCSGIRSSLGLDPAPPDEFSVVTKAPLTMPPDFTLRPPEPGAVRPQEQQPRQSAETALMGKAAPDLPGSGGAAAETPGEQALLKQAGAANVNPRIRQVVNSESSQLAERDKSFTDKLIFWQKAQPEGTVINPSKEAQRLRQNAALGQPVTQGETPTIVRRKRGILEGIF